MPETSPPVTPPRPHLNTRQTTRLPPPTLFQGPPSRNASHISLALPGASAAAIGLPSTSSPTGQPSHQPHHRRFSRVPDSTNIGSLIAARTRQREVKNENDRADALWAEMQNTLADVELSAVNGSHVFGAEHAKALEDLRTAQLALAQAWAKSEAEETIDHHDYDNETLEKKKSASPTASTAKSKDGEARIKASEDDSQMDILLARRRREANDRYFQQVNSGVLDVVAKLEDVAGAMSQVENESREIWNDSDGSGSGSMTEGNAAGHG